MAKADDTKRPSGPEPERVKINGDWVKAVNKALKKPRPQEGWPKAEKK